MAMIPSRRLSAYTKTLASFFWFDVEHETRRSTALARDSEARRARTARCRLSFHAGQSQTELIELHLIQKAPVAVAIATKRETAAS